MNHTKAQTVRAAFVLLVSVALAAFVTWFAPSWSAAATGMLFRLRGEMRPPGDIVIVAIDDRSIQQVGKWPWSRSVMADLLQRISASKPNAVGLDIIYSEASTPEEDAKLVQAIKDNGQVILPAQLIEAKKEDAQTIIWLRPLPEFESATKSVGHAHVSPDVDGMLRSIQLSKADNRGERLWAFGVEVLRIAEQIPEENIEEQNGALRLGSYSVPVSDEDVGPQARGVTVIRANETTINYIGPTGSFPYFSVADVLGGNAPKEAFANKIVLIGAVAQSLGDTRVTPFVNYRSGERQSGQEMPGIEVHANIINTIRGGLSLKHFSETTNFIIALFVILSTWLVIKFLDGWLQILGLSLLLFAISCGSFVAFSKYQVVMPLAGMLTGFIAATPLLLNRTLTASQHLDRKLEALVHTQRGFLLDQEEEVSNEERLIWLDFPRSLEWKLRAVDSVTAKLLARMGFMDRVLNGMGDGVLVADAEGRIVFANPEASKIFGHWPTELLETNLAEILLDHNVFNEEELREIFGQIQTEQVFEKEFQTKDETAKHYTLQMSAIVSRAETKKDAGPTNNDMTAVPLVRHRVIGILVLTSDISRRVELERTRMETLQLVSHELRTPLTSIRGLSDVLMKFPVEASEARVMLETINAEAVRLSETINRYLDITRLESGRQSLSLKSVGVEKMLASCVRLHRPLAAERAIEIKLKCGEILSSFTADEQLLAQAVNNLLSNAIKYSPHNTTIEVTAAEKDEELQIKVCDEGLGIPQSERERVFEKFYRLERDAKSETIGTGLGLPLVREIVEKHKGRIIIESELGEGSTFIIILPLKL